MPAIHTARCLLLLKSHIKVAAGHSIGRKGMVLLTTPAAGALFAGGAPPLEEPPPEEEEPLLLLLLSEPDEPLE